jgi:uncharacterized glyoxalase superfamily protein PhnB
MKVQVDLVVSDVKATAEFYRAVGVDVPELWEQNGVAHHVEVPDAGLGFNSRALTRGYDAGWPDSSGVVFIFHLPTREAVDARFGELSEAGYRAHMAPIDAFWGARYAIVDDPDGNHVGLMSPSDREHESAPGLSE